MRDSRAERAQPLYREIVEVLAGEIAGGRFALGERLPTEAALCRRFGASRHTVRAALKACQDAGLIRRRQGSGSVVVADRPQPRFASSIATVEELMQYAAATRLQVLARDSLRAPAGFPEAGRAHWTRVTAQRRDTPDGLPIAHTEIWLPPRFAEVAPDIGRARHAVCRLIEQRYGLRVSAVRQSIQAAAACDDVATGLCIQPGTPVLRIERRYEASPEGVVEIAVSHHPAGRYSYDLTLRQTG